MQTNTGYNGINRTILLLVLFLVIMLVVLAGFNVYLLINNDYHASLPERAEEERQLDYKRAVAKDILEYSRELASDLGVLDKTPVVEMLAGFNYEMEIATESDDLTQIILTHGRRLQEVILREWEIEQQERVLSVVNQDKNVQEVNKLLHLNLSIDEEGVEANPEDLLNEVTVHRINEIYQSNNLGRSYELEIEIREGEGNIVSPDDPMEQIQALNEEIDDLRLTLRELRVEAGFAEMRGEGIIVELSDGEEAVTSDALIHDTDVRDLVNELFSAGAQGVAVGGYRLTATTSIRCAGNLIKVDGNNIPMPVEIKAVGDPELLESGLQIIKNNLEVNRNLGVDIEVKEDVSLPAH